MQGSGLPAVCQAHVQRYLTAIKCSATQTVEHLSTIATPASYMDGAIVSTGTYARPMGGVPPQFVDL
jgi:hypothetical protein